MLSVSISAPDDRSFPFTREIFEDRKILYHGSWSTYSSRIESEGLLSGYATFDVAPFVAISEPLIAVGLGSFFSGFFHGSPFSSREVFFSASFWGARAYATDAGGELVRMTIKDATNFEQICTVAEERSCLIRRWENGLQAHPNHAPTVAAVALLKNEGRMRELYASVATARRQLLTLSEGGHPVVYAVRVEPSWFGEHWETYLRKWCELGVGGTELRCRGVSICPDRLVGRADYPHGADSTFDPSHITTWVDVEEISHG